jgi:hypothetical protein
MLDKKEVNCYTISFSDLDPQYGFLEVDPPKYPEVPVVAPVGPHPVTTFTQVS